MNSALTVAENILPESLASITTISSDTFTPDIFGNQTAAYGTISGSSYNSDVRLQVKQQNLVVIENNNKSVFLDLSCSEGGTTPITYNFGSYNGGSQPAWVNLNVNTGELGMITPNVNSDAEFIFL